MNRLFRNNLTAKILAIILAVILWLYVMNEQNPPIEASFTIPLEVKNLAEGYQVIDAPETVRIKVRGPRSIIAGVTAKDLQAYVDLRGIGEGRMTMKVATIVPSSTEVAEINPDKVVLHIDKTYSRTYPVEVKTSGTTPTGFTLSKTELKTDHVIIDGPKSVLDTIERIVVQFDLSNRQGEGTVSLPVVALNREGKVIEELQIHPEKVNLTFVMTQVGTKKSVDVKPVLAGELPQGIVIKQIVVEPDKVEVSGTKSLLDKLDAIQTEPLLITGLTKETSFEAKLMLKEGLTSSLTHVTVRITVSPKE